MLKIKKVSLASKIRVSVVMIGLLAAALTPFLNNPINNPESQKEVFEFNHRYFKNEADAKDAQSKFYAMSNLINIMGENGESTPIDYKPVVAEFLDFISKLFVIKTFEMDNSDENNFIYDDMTSEQIKQTKQREILGQIRYGDLNDITKAVKYAQASKIGENWIFTPLQRMLMSVIGDGSEQSFSKAEIEYGIKKKALRLFVDNFKKSYQEIETNGFINSIIGTGEIKLPAIGLVPSDKTKENMQAALGDASGLMYTKVFISKYETYKKLIVASHTTDSKLNDFTKGKTDEVLAKLTEMISGKSISGWNNSERYSTEEIELRDLLSKIETENNKLSGTEVNGNVGRNTIIGTNWAPSGDETDLEYEDWQLDLAKLIQRREELGKQGFKPADLGVVFGFNYKETGDGSGNDYSKEQFKLISNLNDTISEIKRLKERIQYLVDNGANENLPADAKVGIDGLAHSKIGIGDDQDYSDYFAIYNTWNDLNGELTVAKKEYQDFVDKTKTSMTDTDGDGISDISENDLFDYINIKTSVVGWNYKKNYSMAQVQYRNLLGEIATLKSQREDLVKDKTVVPAPAGVSSDNAKGIGASDGVRYTEEQIKLREYNEIINELSSSVLKTGAQGLVAAPSGGLLNPIDPNAHSDKVGLGDGNVYSSEFVKSFTEYTKLEKKADDAKQMLATLKLKYGENFETKFGKDLEDISNDGAQVGLNTNSQYTDEEVQLRDLTDELNKLLKDKNDAAKEVAALKIKIGDDTITSHLEKLSGLDRVLNTPIEGKNTAAFGDGTGNEYSRKEKEIYDALSMLKNEFPNGNPFWKNDGHSSDADSDEAWESFFSEWKKHKDSGTQVVNNIEQGDSSGVIFNSEVFGDFKNHIFDKLKDSGIMGALTGVINFLKNNGGAFPVNSPGINDDSGFSVGNTPKGDFSGNTYMDLDDAIKEYLKGTGLKQEVKDRQSDVDNSQKALDDYNAFILKYPDVGGQLDSLEQSLKDAGVEQKASATRLSEAITKLQEAKDNKEKATADFDSLLESIETQVSTFSDDNLFKTNSKDKFSPIIQQPVQDIIDSLLGIDLNDNLAGTITLKQTEAKINLGKDEVKLNSLISSLSNAKSLLSNLKVDRRYSEWVKLDHSKPFDPNDLVKPNGASDGQSYSREQIDARDLYAHILNVIKMNYQWDPSTEFGKLEGIQESSVEGKQQPGTGDWSGIKYTPQEFALKDQVTKEMHEGIEVYDKLVKIFGVDTMKDSLSSGVAPDIKNILPGESTYYLHTNWKNEFIDRIDDIKKAVSFFKLHPRLRGMTSSSLAGVLNKAPVGDGNEYANWEKWEIDLREEYVKYKLTLSSLISKGLKPAPANAVASAYKQDTIKYFENLQKALISVTTLQEQFDNINLKISSENKIIDTIVPGSDLDKTKFYLDKNGKQQDLNTLISKINAAKEVERLKKELKHKSDECKTASSVFLSAAIEKKDADKALATAADLFKKSEEGLRVYKNNQSKDKAAKIADLTSKLNSARDQLTKSNGDVSLWERTMQAFVIMMSGKWADQKDHSADSRFDAIRIKTTSNVDELFSSIIKVRATIKTNKPTNVWNKNVSKGNPGVAITDNTQNTKPNKMFSQEIIDLRNNLELLWKPKLGDVFDMKKAESSFFGMVELFREGGKNRDGYTSFNNLFSKINSGGGFDFTSQDWSSITQKDINGFIVFFTNDINSKTSSSNIAPTGDGSGFRYSNGVINFLSLDIDDDKIKAAQLISGKVLNAKIDKMSIKSKVGVNNPAKGDMSGNTYTSEEIEYYNKYILSLDKTKEWKEKQNDVNELLASPNVVKAAPKGVMASGVKTHKELFGDGSGNDYDTETIQDASKFIINFDNLKTATSDISELKNNYEKANKNDKGYISWDILIKTKKGVVEGLNHEVYYSQQEIDREEDIDDKTNYESEREKILQKMKSQGSDVRPAPKGAVLGLNSKPKGNGDGSLYSESQINKRDEINRLNNLISQKTKSLEKFKGLKAAPADVVGVDKDNYHENGVGDQSGKYYSQKVFDDKLKLDKLKTGIDSSQDKLNALKSAVGEWKLAEVFKAHSDGMVNGINSKETYSKQSFELKEDRLKLSSLDIKRLAQKQITDAKASGIDLKSGAIIGHNQEKIGVGNDKYYSHEEIELRDDIEKIKNIENKQKILSEDDVAKIKYFTESKFTKSSESILDFYLGIDLLKAVVGINHHGVGDRSGATYSNLEVNSFSDKEILKSLIKNNEIRKEELLNKGLEPAPSSVNGKLVVPISPLEASLANDGTVAGQHLDARGDQTGRIYTPLEIDEAMEYKIKLDEKAKADKELNDFIDSNKDEVDYFKQRTLNGVEWKPIVGWNYSDASYKYREMLDDIKELNVGKTMVDMSGEDTSVIGSNASNFGVGSESALKTIVMYRDSSGKDKTSSDIEKDILGSDKARIGFVLVPNNVLDANSKVFTSMESIVGYLENHTELIPNGLLNKIASLSHMATSETKDIYKITEINVSKDRYNEMVDNYHWGEK